MSDHSDRFFKGWAKPGALLPTDRAIPDLEAGESLDALCGDLRLFQLKNGHRFSTDDVLTGWCGTTWCPAARTILDLGSGIGTVATIAAWRCPAARVVTIEAQAESVRLARKSAAYNELTARMEIREGDFRDTTVLGAGERFDLVLGSPPYFPAEAGVHGDHPQKIACRFELKGDIGDYCQVAARQLDWGGVFACVFPVRPKEQLDRVKAAANAHELTIVRWRPVILKEGEEPLLGLFAMTRADHLPVWFRTETWIEPPLVIRSRDGSVHPEYRAVKLAFGFPP
jgi:tRNA1(Val) A37 N6-methylase TrmN6